MFVLPSVVKGTGIFPDAKPCAIEAGTRYPLTGIQDGTNLPPFFSDFPTARAVLVLSMALQTKVALEMVGFDGAGSIFTEGGFSRNRDYNMVLSSIYPQAQVAVTRFEEATLSQLSEDQLEELGRNRLRFGDVCGSDGNPLTAPGQLEDGPQGVLAFLGDIHSRTIHHTLLIR